MAKGTGKKNNSQGRQSQGTKGAAAVRKTGALGGASKKKTASGKKTASAKRTPSPKKTPAASDSSKASSELMQTVNSMMSYPEEKSVPIGKEILIWVVGAIAALMLVSCFIPQGVAGDVISTFFFGVFGMMAYAFPFVFFFAFLFYLRKHEHDPNTWRQLLGLALVFVFLCALIHLLFYDNIPVDTPMEFYRISSEDRIGGGLLGGIQVFVYSLAFGTVGAYVLTIAGLAISFILFTQKPIFAGMGLDEETARRRRLARDVARAEKRARDERMRRLQEEKRLEEEKRRLEEKNRLAEETLAKRRAQEAAMNAPADTQPDPDEKALEAQRRIDISYMMNDKGTGRGRFADLSNESAVPAFLKKFTSGRANRPADEKAPDKKMDTQAFKKFLEEEQSSLADNISAIVEDRDPSALSPEEASMPDFDAERYAADEPFMLEEALAIPAGEAASYDEPAVPSSQDEAVLAVEEPPYAAKEGEGDNQSALKAGEETGEAAASPAPSEPENENTGAGRRRRKAARRISKEDLSAETALVGEAAGAALSSKEAAGLAEEDKNPAQTGVLYPGEGESGLPSLLRLEPVKVRGGNLTQETETKKQLLADLFTSFGVNAVVGNVSIGPTVTRYEIYPGIGVKVSKIMSLQDDIKLKLATADIRIEAPIPGTNAIGIEVPNTTNVIVPLREILEDDAFVRAKSRLTFAVGKDLGGKAVVFNIAKMPHLLIAGATGSGKSVCINTLIMSILYKARPDEVKMLMIDPKMVELKVYDALPHLLIPVVTDAKKAAGALNWAVQEMMGRYQKFSSAGVRDLAGYNASLEKRNAKIEEENFLRGGDEGYKKKAPLEKMAQIVIIVDELADLMMAAPKEVEEAICRLAQLARAAGIHLVIATQRPSVNVITGLIKANMPSRIALAVSSNVDSRTIIDMNGAEKLLGNGDMLFYPQGYSKPVRVQGAYVKEEEIARVMDFYKAMAAGGVSDSAKAQEIEDMITKNVNNQGALAGEEEASGDERDEYFVKAGRLIVEKSKASIGMLQRNYKIGFNRAARIMDQLCEAGVVGPEEGTKPRRILMTLSEFDAAFGQGGFGGQFIEVPDEVTPFDEF